MTGDLGSGKSLITVELLRDYGAAKKRIATNMNINPQNLWPDKNVQYGLKRLAKVEQTIQERLKREAKRYNKSYPGELVHLDTKRLPLLKGQSANKPREYLFVAIDDFSRELYADIFPIKPSIVQLAFSQALLLNVLTRSTMLILTTAKNLKELTAMLLSKLAGSTVSVRSLLVSIVRKPTGKLSGSSVL